MTVNVHEAKTHFSRLLEQVHAGQEIILSKAGKPYARMLPLEAETPTRMPGRLAGLALSLLAERLELAGLELREAEIRLVQAGVLALTGMILFALALGLAVVCVMLVLPEPWRPWAAGAGAGVCLLCGWWALFALRRRLSRRPLAFAQTIEELKKDRACF